MAEELTASKFHSFLCSGIFKSPKGTNGKLDIQIQHVCLSVLLAGKTQFSFFKNYLSGNKFEVVS